jgi:predicted alpha-1,6-mannanase (GH76 family)
MLAAIGVRLGSVTVWADRASEAVRALVDSYWDAARGLFRITTAPRPLWWCRRWHYWWQAHALDVLVRAGDAERAGVLVDGVLRRNGGHIVNDYYDDMAWMGLALQAGTEAGLLSAGPLVGRLVAELRGGFDAEHGAVRWRRGDEYLNVAANAPAAILFARAGDRAFARRLTDWLHTVLVTADGVVWDGVHPGQPPDEASYTYNYGIVVGADVAVGALDGARRVSAAALATLPRRDGLLPDEGSGDGGLFKGVFARHVGSSLQVVDDAAMRDLLVRNAEAAWSARSPAGLFGPDWSRPPSGAVELSTHLSGVLLLQTVASLPG